MKNNFNIEVLTKKSLIEALEANTFWKNKRVPIPKSKARWLIANERIASDDVCAVIGLENGEIIGYTFVISDRIQIEKNRIEKLSWIHLWWVHEKFEGHIFGMYLFNETVKQLNGKVLINSYLERNNRFFEKGPFRIINKRKRYTIFFFLDPNILIARFRFLKYFKILIKLTNYIISGIRNYFKKKRIARKTKDVSYEYVNQIDNELWLLIEKGCKEDFVLKDKAYVNWHMDNSQYTQTPVSKKFRHSFSSTGYAPNIFLHNLKVFRGNDLIGFISYVVCAREFNVKYFLVKNSSCVSECIAALLEHFFASGSSYIITDDAQLSARIEKEYHPFYIYKIDKKTILHKDVNLSFETVSITDRDGRFH